MSLLPVIHEPSRLICPQHLPIYFSWRGLAVSITRLAASGFSQRKKQSTQCMPATTCKQVSQLPHHIRCSS